MRLLAACAALVLAHGAGLLSVAAQQKFGSADRERGREMLKIVKEDLERFYYDPTFRGMDVKARFKEADEKIKTATSNGQIFGIIAQVLADLNDSHTFFLPPGRVAGTDYGWEMAMVGDRCFVVEVDPGSDAEAKGVRVGDEVWSIDGFQPTRENMWKIKYSYYGLKPRAGMRLVLQDAAGRQREVDVLARVIEGKDRFLPRKESELAEEFRFHEVKDELIVWKMPTFTVTNKQIDEAMKRVAPFKSVVIDMRGNGGGYEDAMLRLVGHFFDREVKLGEVKQRKGSKPLVAKSRGEGVYKGRLVVLVDSGSGSAAEVFARVAQLEKRGTVVGDRSAGAVMRSRLYGEADVIEGFDTYKATFFAVSITDADLIMADGRSLEVEGVRPDELLLPTGADLSARRDPVLARAAALAGVELSPEQSGALFPVVRLKPEDKKNKKEKAEKKEKS